MAVEKLSDISRDIVDTFRVVGYSEAYVLSVGKTVRKILRLHEEQGHETFNPEIAMSFITETERRYKSGAISRSRFIEVRAISEHLISFAQSGSINTKKRRITPLLPDFYEKFLSEISEYEEWSVKMRNDVITHVRPYFSWLADNGINDISKANIGIVREYFTDISSRMSKLSMDSIRHGIKKMYALALEKGYVTVSYDNALSFKIATVRRILPFTPQDEIAQVLSVINKNKARGKRDYAIYLLLAVFGLRGVDVVSLTFDSIDWRNGEIKIIQSKTGKSIALPLTEAVGAALQEYILNARPKSTEQRIFLNVNAPFGKLDASSLYTNYQNYRKKANLPTPSPLHGIRRSIATNMIIQGIPTTTVAQLLGHAKIDSTKQYVSLDSKHLAECALDFAGIEVGGGYRESL